MPDSTTLGYITPSTEDSTDRPLEDIFQAAIKGITGIPGKYVRPQAPDVIANLPEVNVDWVSFRVSVTEFDFDAHQQHQPALLTTGGNVVSRDERLDLVMSFYGPLAHRYVNRMVNGLAIDQNRWVLMDSGIKLIGIGQPVNLPSLLKEKWERRLDLTTTFSRRLHTNYPVRTVVEAGLGIDNERYITPIIVQQP